MCAGRAVSPSELLERAEAAEMRAAWGSTPRSMRWVRWHVSSGGRRDRKERIALRLGGVEEEVSKYEIIVKT